MGKRRKSLIYKSIKMKQKIVIRVIIMIITILLAGIIWDIKMPHDTFNAVYQELRFGGLHMSIMWIFAIALVCEIVEFCSEIFD